MVCGALQEQDFVAGLAAVRKREPSIEELVYQHEIAGDYGDALACYESMGKDAAKDKGGTGSSSSGSGGRDDVLAGIVKCYLEIDRPHTASSLAKARRTSANFRFQKQCRKIFF